MYRSGIIRKTPEDIDKRLKLIGYYDWNGHDLLRMSPALTVHSLGKTWVAASRISSRLSSPRGLVRRGATGDMVAVPLQTKRTLRYLILRHRNVKDAPRSEARVLSALKEAARSRTTCAE